MELTKELALSLIQSGNQFPVDFDDAWQWIGYVNKQAAKKKLTRNFEAGIDYLSKWMSVAHSNSSSASRTERIALSVDCFKSLAMMAGTDRGKDVRRYFLECEKTLKRLTEPKLELPPADVRICNLHNALQSFGIDINNPRLNQHIQDLVMDKILGVAPSLPGSTEEWIGVVEAAERMGYPVALIADNRSQLGKYVASFNLQKKKEKRLCNGTHRDINLYLDCEAFRSAVAEFMDAKILTTASKTA